MSTEQNPVATTFALYNLMIGSLTIVDGATIGVNRILSCDADFICSFSSDPAGFDGRIYRFTEVTVTEEGDVAYNASGRVYDPNHGYLDVTTEKPFTLNCPTERPGSGRLNFVGASQSSGTIVFISCEEYVITTSTGLPIPIDGDVSVMCVHRVSALLLSTKLLLS